MRYALLALVVTVGVAPAGCAEQPVPPPPQARFWYSGGTMHNADSARWSQATDQNRLATSADLVVKRLIQQGANPSTLEVERIKPWATELKDCISKALDEGADDGRVPDVAESCLDGMPLRWPPE